MGKEEKLPDDINDTDEEDGIGGIEVIKGDDKDDESDAWLGLDEDDTDNRVDLKLELGSSYSGDSDDQL